MRSAVWGGVDYPVTQGFLLHVHDGIDIGMDAGKTIYAARAGVVERVQTGMTSIRLGALRDFYLHGTSLVAVGQAVAQGQGVIRSGAVTVDSRYPVSGPHLHFETQNGFSLPGAPPYAEGAPLDPVPVLTGLYGGAPGSMEEAVDLSEKIGWIRTANAGVGVFFTPDGSQDAAVISAAQTIHDNGDNLDTVLKSIINSPNGLLWQKIAADLRAGTLTGAQGLKGDKGDPGLDGAPGKDGATGQTGSAPKSATFPVTVTFP